MAACIDAQRKNHQSIFHRALSISIGRDPGNEICISDSLPGRRHARITVAGADEIIEDPCQQWD